MSGRKRILVVEDQELNRDLLVQILEDAYAVLVSVDGADAVAQAERERPDLILMDFGMPVMDGWEATRRIKAHPQLRHIPIIAITSHAMEIAVGFWPCWQRSAASGPACAASG